MEKISLPNHIAIIMDGNGRWAKSRGLNRTIGHEQGAKTLHDIIEYIHELKIKYVTLYTFSSENWQRPQHEVNSIMLILERYLRENINEMVKNGIRLLAIGNLAKLPTYLRLLLEDMIDKTKHCDKLILTLALSYGAKQEVTYAIQKIAQDVVDKKINLKDIDENILNKNLSTNNLPDPDLFIRTGGEVRLSNFLLMQLSYSELYFCKTLWPDFKRTDLKKALLNFSERERRFGRLS